VELLGPVRFRSDTRKAIETLSSITGEPVVCYRAPFFSIGKNTMWALAVLCELGIRYDSSILPARSWRCGYPGFPRGITEITTGSGVITEVPVSTVTVFSTCIPVGGGAWFRILPLWFTLRGFSTLTAEGKTAVFYIHPWELDIGQPLRMFEPRAWLCHYWNIRSTRKKMDMLLDRYSFTSIGTYFSEGEQDVGSACKTEDRTVQVRRE
jgi:polysaccharide deacetylase family protein (PEP-CTERM system associated)